MPDYNHTGSRFPSTKEEATGHVFPYYESESYHGSDALFRDDADKVGLNDVRLHHLRHTCATYRITNGVSLRVV